MKGYLVLLRSTFDDFPVALVRRRREAKRMVTEILADPESALRSLEIELTSYARHTLYGVDLIRFDNGRAVRREIFSFQDEDGGEIDEVKVSI